MSYRLLDQNPVYFSAEGAPLAGGTVYFFENNTTTPKVVYGDKALAVNLGTSVALNEEGRVDEDVWLDGAYSIEVQDFDGNPVWNRDNVEASDPFPSGTEGQVLSLVAGVPTFVTIRQVPDYSGATNGDVLTIVAGEPVFQAPAAGTHPYDICVPVSDESTAITTGAAKRTFRAQRAVTLTAIRASLGTASGTGAVTVDVNKNAVSMFSTLLTVDEGERTSATAATPAVLSATTLAEGDEITVDIDGAGSGAKGLKIYFIGSVA